MMMLNTRKMKSRGFGLVELLIVIVILGILAGVSVLAFGRGSDNAEAAAIMANLDAAKNALLAYSMEYRTRNVDPLSRDIVGRSGEDIMSRIDKYLDAGMKSESNSAARHFKHLSVRYVSQFEVGFDGITVTSGVKSALNRRIDATGGAYTKEEDPYSVWLPIR